MTINIHKRPEWRAKPPTEALRRVAPGSRTHGFLHYSLGEELGNKDIAQWLRNIQDYHQGHNGWSDIGYNLLIDNSGAIWEGRGWDYAGAHCPDFNTIGYGFCFLGDDDPGVTDVSQAAKRAIKDVFREADDRSDTQLIRLGHRDRRQTKCPGDELYAWLRAGMPLDARVPMPPPSNKPKPGPVPAFPLPEGHWFGPPSSDPRNHSGYYSRTDRHNIARLQVELNRIGISVTVDGFYADKMVRAAKALERRGAKTGIPGCMGERMWRFAFAAPSK